MRKKDAELRRTLLTTAGKIECEEGVDAINIRRLASEVGIAVGTVYNYFDSKQEVLLALTEEYWDNALKEMRQSITAVRFTEQVAQIISFLRMKMNDCAEILMKNLHDDAESARLRMVSMQRVLRHALVERLEQDDEIPARVWNEAFTKEAFADFVLSNLILMLQQRQTSEKMFLEVLERILYKTEA